MKKLHFLAMAFVLIFSASLFAQGPGGTGSEGRRMDPIKRAEEQSALMTEKLALSEAQSAKIGEINLKYAQKMKDAREANAEGDWSAMREKMTSIRTEQDAELKTMMTSDQWATWEKIRDEERAKQREGRRKKEGENKQ